MTDPHPKRTATHGHQLLEAWLCRRYGRSARTGRPAFGGMRLFVIDLNASLPREADPLAQAITVYEWLATAKRGPKKPREVYRKAIERMSRGAVPMGAWGEVAAPVQQAVA